MKTIINKIPYIRVNDIFDELMDENQRLKQCLKVLIEFKAIVDSISLKFNENLISIESQKFEDINKEVEEVFKSNELIILLGKVNQTNGEIQDIQKTLSEGLTPELSQIKSETNKPNNRKLREILNKNNSKRVLRPKREPIPASELGYICDWIGCGTVLKSKQTLCQHKRIHRNKVCYKYRCDIHGCGFKTPDKHKYTYHMNGHKGIKPFKCDICGQRFTRPSSVKHHHNVTHTVDEETIICGTDGCKKQFNNRFRYLSHQKDVHRPRKRVLCSEGCGQTFISNYTLKLHIEYIHTNPDCRPFHCSAPNCNKSFKTKATLNGHLTSHNREKNFICEFEDCKRAYKTSSALKHHLVGYHSDNSFGCDWPGCEYTTKYNSCLKTHRKTHNKERNHPCLWPQCGKSFGNQQRLKTHLRIHTCDKRYACPWPGCVYRCTDSGNLVKHRKQVHKI